VSERNPNTQYAGRRMESFIYLFCLQSHPRPHRRVLRPQGRHQVSIVEIFIDDSGFDNNCPKVAYCRHHAVGVEREIIRFLLIRRPQIEVEIGPVEPLLRQGQRYLLRDEKVPA